MKKYELSKIDFELLDEALNVEMKLSSGARQARLEQLRDKLRSAHTGYLEIEEDN